MEFNLESGKRVILQSSERLFVIFTKNNFFEEKLRERFAKNIGGKTGVVGRVDNKYGYFSFTPDDSYGGNSYSIPFESIDMKATVFSTNPMSEAPGIKDYSAAFRKQIRNLSHENIEDIAILFDKAVKEARNVPADAWIMLSREAFIKILSDCYNLMIENRDKHGFPESASQNKAVCETVDGLESADTMLSRAEIAELKGITFLK